MRKFINNLRFFKHLEGRTDILARIITHRMLTEDNYPPEDKYWSNVFWDNYMVPLGIYREMSRADIHQYLLRAVNNRVDIYLDAWPKMACKMDDERLSAT